MARVEQWQSLNSKVEECTSQRMDKSIITWEICLAEIRKQAVGRPTSCKHLFCAFCILEWWKDGTATCPFDRYHITGVFVYKDINNMSGKDISYYSKGCNKCHLILDLFTCIICYNCNTMHHHSCLGVKPREEYKLLCPACLKKPFHRTNCFCLRCKPVKRRTVRI